jgi:cystathionine beta-lyase/cystathionine gamma-synthase
VARRVLEGASGGMVSFELRGGRAAADRFCQALNLVSVMASFADVATTVSYPMTTSHRGMTAAEHAELGITPGLLRLSAGIEDADDIRADLDAALAAAG